MKEACSSKYPNFLKLFSQKINVDSGTDHSTQQCLLAMLEKWKRSVDSGKAY